MPAISGAVTNCAAHATADGESASNCGATPGHQAARPDRRDDHQRRRRHHRQSQAHIDGQLRRDAPSTAARSPTAPEWPPAPRRQHTHQAIAPITAARSTLAVGCTTTTNSTRATPASATAARGPISRDKNSTAPQTIVTLAPDTAVRCEPCRADSWLVTGGDRRHVTEDQRRQHRRRIGGQHSTSRGGEPARTAYAARFTGPARPAVGAPMAFTTATVKSRRVGRRDRRGTAAAARPSPR